MNRADRRRIAALLGVPPERIVRFHPNGQVEVCFDGSCVGDH